MKKIVKSYKYLYDKKVIHRDMKPDNLLYNLLENGEKDIKICDFGMATNSLASKNNSIVGTEIYWASELRTGIYDDKVDIFSLGVIIFEVLIGEHPMETDCQDLGKPINSKAVEELLKKEKVSTVLIDFVMRCI